MTEISICCHEPVTVVGDTTMYYVCGSCAKACDIEVTWSHPKTIDEVLSALGIEPDTRDYTSNYKKSKELLIEYVEGLIPKKRPHKGWCNEIILTSEECGCGSKEYNEAIDDIRKKIL